MDILGWISLILIVEDIKTGLLPMLWLMVWGVLLVLMNGGNNILSVGVITSISLALWGYYRLRALSIPIGLGDILLLILCSIGLPVAHLSLFLILCGALGIGTAWLWRHQWPDATFPFAPAIIIAYWLTLIIQGQNAFSLL